MNRFYVGLHQPSDAQHFSHAFISLSRLWARKSAFSVQDWVMDSESFSSVSTYGDHRFTVAEHAAQINRWAMCGRLNAAVAQDYMCEPWIIERTGKSVAEHQRLTIERYDELLTHELPVYILPVLQGYDPSDYREHVRAYGRRLVNGAWVGVGSVCKRNGKPGDVSRVLHAIKSERADLLLHGFGLKLASLLDPTVRSLVHTGDSIAWSFAARKQGRNPNDWREAKAFEARILAGPEEGPQLSLDFTQSCGTAPFHQPAA